MKFAKIVFIIAGLYGLATLVPGYFMEARIDFDAPPPIAHPEYFYGFPGVALAWQILFFVIAHDPVRHRSVIPAAFLEKLGYRAAAVALFVAHRIQATVLGFGLIDLLLGILLLGAFAVIPKTRQ